MGDFAENDTFSIQDEIQSYHWHKQYCTLHPVVLYYKEKGQLVEKSFCFLSDDLNHDTCFVYKVQTDLVNAVKKELQQLKKFEYFSDGCSGQYKNFKNWSNLTFNEADFGIKAKWIFFATSHGKSACDGIGGTVKRLTKRASLQRPYGNFILTVEAMLDFCKENIPNINFIHIGKTDMVDVRKKLEARFQIGRTIPGTRSFHHFEPFGPYTVCYKRTSDSKDFVGTFNISGGGNQLILLKELQANEYIACHYEKQWWIGIIEEVSSEEQDVLVNFFTSTWSS